MNKYKITKTTNTKDGIEINQLQCGNINTIFLSNIMIDWNYDEIWEKDLKDKEVGYWYVYDISTKEIVDSSLNHNDNISDLTLFRMTIQLLYDDITKKIDNASEWSHYKSLDAVRQETLKEVLDLIDKTTSKEEKLNNESNADMSVQQIVDRQNQKCPFNKEEIEKCLMLQGKWAVQFIKDNTSLSTEDYVIEHWNDTSTK